MGSAIASGFRASPIALTNVRTGLAADAIAVALIENLHCLQGKLPQHAKRLSPAFCSLTPKNLALLSLSSKCSAY